MYRFLIVPLVGRTFDIVASVEFHASIDPNPRYWVRVVEGLLLVPPLAIVEVFEGAVRMKFHLGLTLVDGVPVGVALIESLSPALRLTEWVVSLAVTAVFDTIALSAEATPFTITQNSNEVPAPGEATNPMFNLLIVQAMGTR